MLIFHLGWSCKKAPHKPQKVLHKLHKLRGRHCILVTCGGHFWWTNPCESLPLCNSCLWICERRRPTPCLSVEKSKSLRVIVFLFEKIEKVEKNENWNKIQRELNWKTSNMKWRRAAWVSTGSPDSHMEINLRKRCGPAETFGQFILVAGRCGCTWGTAPRFQSLMTSSSAMLLCTLARSTKNVEPQLPQSMFMKLYVELTFVDAWTPWLWIWLCDPVVIMITVITVQKQAYDSLTLLIRGIAKTFQKMPEHFNFAFLPNRKTGMVEWRYLSIPAFIWIGLCAKKALEIEITDLVLPCAESILERPAAKNYSTTTDTDSDTSW